MNAANVKAAWNWFPLRRKRPKRGQLGFALDEGGREHGLPASVARDRARAEHEARVALRDWLML
jgi:hypothetical protein